MTGPHKADLNHHDPSNSMVVPKLGLMRSDLKYQERKFSLFMLGIYDVLLVTVTVTVTVTVCRFGFDSTHKAPMPEH